ncbi:MAG: ChbG/HpnK family deacetylase [Bacteroidales bacterium]|nr:ChbG/HpnK family deacetylase [Bacteroidales bacterium]
MRGLRIIVNADDLGYSVDVDAQIERCIQHGIVTSSSLMANAPGFDDGVRIAKMYPNVSIGAHLNLVEFAPLTNLDVFQRYGVADASGNFIEGAIFYTAIDDVLSQAVFDEWDAQLNKIKRSGVVIDHVDSHQHTHALLGLHDTLCKVMDKHQITRVRRKIVPSIPIMLFGKKTIKVTLDKSNAVVGKKRNVLVRRFQLLSVIASSIKWNMVMSRKYQLTDSFSSFREFYMNRSLMISGGRNAVIELMCHPGQPPFDCETQLLASDRKWITSRDKLVNYKIV